MWRFLQVLQKLGYFDKIQLQQESETDSVKMSCQSESEMIGNQQLQPFWKMGTTRVQNHVPKTRPTEGKLFS